MSSGCETYHTSLDFYYSNYYNITQTHLLSQQKEFIPRIPLLQRNPTVQNTRQSKAQSVSSEQSSTFVQSFKQQMLKAWLPIPTLTKAIVLFFIMSAIFLGGGIPMMILSGNIVEVTVDYDNICTPNQINCTLPFVVPALMQKPVYLYYQLNNYYQNHRLYTSSISYKQLAGNNMTVSDIQTICSPIVTNADLNVTTSITGAPLVPTDPANPCGIVTFTYFTDTFNVVDPKSNNLTMTTDGIAWPSDVAKFQLPTATAASAWLNYTDPRVMNWIRIATLPDFRKLWGIINQDLPAGNYTLIVNNTYTVSQFNTNKYFVLSTSNFFGSKNTFLSITYLVMGCVCFAIGLAFLIKKIRKDVKIHHKQ